MYTTFSHCCYVKVEFEPDFWILHTVTRCLSLSIPVPRPPCDPLDFQWRGATTCAAEECCGLAKWSVRLAFNPVCLLVYGENIAGFLDPPGLVFFTSCSTWAVQWAQIVSRKSCFSHHHSELVDFILIRWRGQELKEKQKIGRIVSNILLNSVLEYLSCSCCLFDASSLPCVRGMSLLPWKCILFALQAVGAAECCRFSAGCSRFTAGMQGLTELLGGRVENKLWNGRRSASWRGLLSRSWF